VTDLDLGERFVAWARQEPSIHALIQIGSRVRAPDTPGAADPDSDWDFQAVSARPELLFGGSVAERAGLGDPIVWVAREGRLGSARKITACFSEGDLDVVVIPAAALRLARWLMRLPSGLRPGRLSRRLADLSVVLRDGYRFRKGELEWGRFFAEVATTVPVARLSDCDVRTLAEGFVCDYLSTWRKIERGELMAAQRWLHHQLAETNFRLLHELRLRADEPSFPDARRIERIVAEPWQSRLAVSAILDPDALRAAAEGTADACRELTRALIGTSWQWPVLPLRREPLPSAQR
jgi:hypothetical protein